MGKNGNEIEDNCVKDRTIRARVEIYALCCPDTGLIRYIGKANDSQKRLKTHFRDMYRRDYPVYRWLRKLTIEGKYPVLRVLVICDSDTWREHEKMQIKKNSHNKLLNVAAGGDMPFCSKEQRAINGASVARSIHDNPDNRHLWNIKRSMGESLCYLKKNGLTGSYNRVIAKLSIAAEKNPKLFGQYASLKPI